MVSAFQLCWGRDQERNNGLSQHFCLGESPHNSHPDSGQLVPPYISLMPFNLLLPCWSLEGMSQSKSVCEHFKANFLRHQKFLSSTASILLVFTARSYGDLSF